MNNDNKHGFVFDEINAKYCSALLWHSFWFHILDDDDLFSKYSW
jgi:hypothetical protein